MRVSSGRVKKKKTLDAPEQMIFVTHLLLLQHIQLRARTGVRVERLHLLVEPPLPRVKLHLLRLQCRHLRLQLLHSGALHGLLQLSLLEEAWEEKPVSGSSSSRWTAAAAARRSSNTYSFGQLTVQLVQAAPRPL